MKTFFSIFMALLLLFLGESCTSDILINTGTFENLLVVDATLTNELKQHEVRLSRTFPFGEDLVLETGATVKVRSESTEIVFTETDPGIYKSTSPFKATPNVIYQLLVETNDGKAYASTNKTLSPQTTINSITIDRVINDDGIDGIGLFVNSFDPTNSSKYYKYEFEETFKVIAPKWTDKDAVVVSDVYPDCEVGLVPRSEDKKVCYTTENSNQLNLTTTALLNEDRVESHLVNFLSNQDYKISHRYSLLLKQFVLSEDGYKYLETLNRFASEGSLFSQVQTGFLVGNMNNINNPSEKVIGFFEVASVNEQRVFFNYRDYYPTEDLPPYIIDCYLTAPEITADFQRELCGGLIGVIKGQLFVFVKEYDGNPVIYEPGPYVMTPKSCGDCTALGTNIVPEFWIE